MTLLGESRRYQQKATDLLRDAESETIEENLLRCAYRRLARRFEVTVRTFERKRYTNLSHEPNKAMNLNTYIALMGGRFRERADGARRLLESAGADERGIASMTSDYVVVLMLTRSCIGGVLARARSFTARTSRVAHSNALQRVSKQEACSGVAATDIQYQVHQGFVPTRRSGSVERDDTEDRVGGAAERGFEVRVFIHDRTVEDTES